MAITFFIVVILHSVFPLNIGVVLFPLGVRLLLDLNIFLLDLNIFLLDVNIFFFDVNIVILLVLFVVVVIFLLDLALRVGDEGSKLVGLQLHLRSKREREVK